MKVAKNIKLEQLKTHGFKYGAREKFIYKTKENGLEARIYVDLQPCHNKNKIINKIYDLTKEGLIEKEQEE